jgi:hypothetical protein
VAIHGLSARHFLLGRRQQSLILLRAPAAYRDGYVAGGNAPLGSVQQIANVRLDQHCRELA